MTLGHHPRRPTGLVLHRTPSAAVRSRLGNGRNRLHRQLRPIGRRASRRNFEVEAAHPARDGRASLELAIANFLATPAGGWELSVRGVPGTTCLVEESADLATWSTVKPHRQPAVRTVDPRSRTQRCRQCAPAPIRSGPLAAIRGARAPILVVLSLRVRSVGSSQVHSRAEAAGSSD